MYQKTKNHRADPMTHSRSVKKAMNLKQIHQPMVLQQLRLQQQRLQQQRLQQQRRLQKTHSVTKYYCQMAVLEGPSGDPGHECTDCRQEKNYYTTGFTVCPKQEAVEKGLHKIRMIYTQCLTDCAGKLTDKCRNGKEKTPDDEYEQMCSSFEDAAENGLVTTKQYDFYRCINICESENKVCEMYESTDDRPGQTLAEYKADVPNDVVVFYSCDSSDTCRICTTDDAIKNNKIGTFSTRPNG
uniref:Uncharacterized protein n=1 Tax=Romanomermis culicivorax TaxID=13658 RepID=A0A915IYA4_ROMCU